VGKFGGLGRFVTRMELRRRSEPWYAQLVTRAVPEQGVLGEGTAKVFSGHNDVVLCRK
jgi:hypothetical protein